MGALTLSSSLRTPISINQEHGVGRVGVRDLKEIGDLALRQQMQALRLALFFSFIIYMCIQGLGHFSPLPPPPPLPPTPPPPSPPHPLNTQQKLFCPYF
jgi:hypothetical protein